MAKKKAVGFIVEHRDHGPMVKSRYREERPALFCGGDVTMFHSRSAAQWAIAVTVAERERFLESLENGHPQRFDTDPFNKKWKYQIRKVVTP